MQPWFKFSSTQLLLLERLHSYPLSRLSVFPQTLFPILLQLFDFAISFILVNPWAVLRERLHSYPLSSLSILPQTLFPILLQLFHFEISFSTILWTSQFFFFHLTTARAILAKKFNVLTFFITLKQILWHVSSSSCVFDTCPGFKSELREGSQNNVFLFQIRQTP